MSETSCWKLNNDPLGGANTFPMPVSAMHYAYHAIRLSRYIVLKKCEYVGVG